MLFARENAVKLRYLSKKYIGKSMSSLERRVSENYIIKSISFHKRKTPFPFFFTPPPSGKSSFLHRVLYGARELTPCIKLNFKIFLLLYSLCNLFLLFMRWHYIYIRYYVYI